MDLTIRPIEESEFDIFRSKLVRVFGGDIHKEDDPKHLRSILDPVRTICAFDGNDLVGTCAAFTFDLTVPGATLAMGGTTMVTVQPTHRRRGILKAMMQAHLKEMKDRGEPLAGLWASESSIYGRYGYGYAVEGSFIKIDAKELIFTNNTQKGSVNLIEADEAAKIFPDIYERIRQTRPGVLSRSTAWWDARVFHDPQHRREGKSAKRFAVYEVDAKPQGYAIYRQKEDWEWEGFSQGIIHVVEVITATDEAHNAIWKFLTSIDLFPIVRYWNAPVDDVLMWRITDPRRIQRYNTDSLWIRIIDIKAALEGRSYSSEGRLVFDIQDEFMPANSGKYELTTNSSEAQCKPTLTEADITLSATSLGALYLGGNLFTTLARAGLVQGTPQALVTADKMFSWTCAPWCPEVF